MLRKDGMGLRHTSSLMLIARRTAAWKLWESNKSTVAWDLVTLNPPFVSL
jgi:hypothetical protein